MTQRRKKQKARKPPTLFMQLLCLFLDKISPSPMEARLFILVICRRRQSHLHFCPPDIKSVARSRGDHSIRFLPSVVSARKSSGLCWARAGKIKHKTRSDSDDLVAWESEWLPLLGADLEGDCALQPRPRTPLISARCCPCAHNLNRRANKFAFARVCACARPTI